MSRALAEVAAEARRRRRADEHEGDPVEDTLRDIRLLEAARAFSRTGDDRADMVKAAAGLLEQIEDADARRAASSHEDPEPITMAGIALVPAANGGFVICEPPETAERLFRDGWRVWISREEDLDAALADRLSNDKRSGDPEIRDPKT